MAAPLRMIGARPAKENRFQNGLSLVGKGSELSRHKSPSLSICTVNCINSKHLSQCEVVWSLLDLTIVSVHFIARLTFLVQNDV